MTVPAEQTITQPNQIPPAYVASPSNTAPNSYSARTAITGSAQSVTFTNGPMWTVYFAVETGASPCYVNINGGAATSSNAQIAAGGNYEWKNIPIYTISWLGTGSTGNVDIIAH